MKVCIVGISGKLGQCMTRVLGTAFRSSRLGNPDARDAVARASAASPSAR